MKEFSNHLRGGRAPVALALFWIFGGLICKSLSLVFGDRTNMGPNHMIALYSGLRSSLCKALLSNV